MSQGRFKGIPRMMERCFNGELSGFQGCLKRSSLGVRGELQRCFKDVSRKFYGVSSRTEGHT